MLIQPKIFGDERGFFAETFKASEFAAVGINTEFKQDNYSLSKQNVLRGLHYQLPPKVQGKMVRVIYGKIWDVAVDIRKSSPTFGKWVGVELSSENNYGFYIPPGFAHGFVTLSPEARVVYKSSEEYAPELERGVNWNDVGLNISWPVNNPILAPRDADFPLLVNAEIFE